MSAGKTVRAAPPLPGDTLPFGSPWPGWRDIGYTVKSARARQRKTYRVDVRALADEIATDRERYRRARRQAQASPVWVGARARDLLLGGLVWYEMTRVRNRRRRYYAILREKDVFARDEPLRRVALPGWYRGTPRPTRP
jgi:hypothetical protein